MNIDMLNPTKEKILGARLSIDGNNSKQVEIIRKTSNSWKEQMRVRQLSRYESCMALNITIWKGLD